MTLKDDVEYERTKEIEELKQKHKKELMELAHKNRLELLDKVMQIAEKAPNINIPIGEI